MGLWYISAVFSVQIGPVVMIHECHLHHELPSDLSICNAREAMTSSVQTGVPINCGVMESLECECMWMDMAMHTRLGTHNTRYQKESDID
ncbi:hypothetical protein NQZ68_004732 [Dissostichus eleginoides]|nr:hypothetical protein NQZ68_004732 [Dissostichus eleginoides]